MRYKLLSIIVLAMLAAACDNGEVTAPEERPGGDEANPDAPAALRLPEAAMRIFGPDVDMLWGDPGVIFELRDDDSCSGVDLSAMRDFEFAPGVADDLGQLAESMLTIDGRRRAIDRAIRYVSDDAPGVVWYCVISPPATAPDTTWIVIDQNVF